MGLEPQLRASVGPVIFVVITKKSSFFFFSVLSKIHHQDFSVLSKIHHQHSAEYSIHVCWPQKNYCWPQKNVCWPQKNSVNIAPQKSKNGYMHIFTRQHEWSNYASYIALVMIKFLAGFYNKKHSMQSDLNPAFNQWNSSYREKTWQCTASFSDSGNINLSFSNSLANSSLVLMGGCQMEWNHSKPQFERCHSRNAKKWTLTLLFCLVWKCCVFFFFFFKLQKLNCIRQETWFYLIFHK